MTSVSERLTYARTKGSRRRARGKDGRVDLSDDEIDMDPKSLQKQQQQEHDLQFKVSVPPLSGNQAVPNEGPDSGRDLVDLDLIAKSLATRKSHANPLPLTKYELERQAEQNGKEGKPTEEEDGKQAVRNEGAHKRQLGWSTISSIWKDPLVDEKKRQEELMLEHMKNTDSSFSEESYLADKRAQDTFINTKKEEVESVRMEREQARRDSRMKTPFWEKVMQATLAVFISSVEAEKRQQENVLLSHLRAMDSSVDEDDLRRQKEAQELFIEMKRREAERQRILQMEEVEKQRRDAILAENMRLPDGLQAGSSSLMIQSSIIEQGAKIQEALRSSFLQAANFSPTQEEEGEEAAQKQIPLHLQKQLQQAVLLQQANENPEVDIDEEDLRHSREIQESLIFYAKKNQRKSWLGSFISQHSSVPQEVSFDDAASVGSRVSWLSGGFGGAGGESINSSKRSWRSSFSKPEEVDQAKNGSRNKWQSRVSNQGPKLGKNGAEVNLHLAGHAEESESANSDL